jgi:hypothetical protein
MWVRKPAVMIAAGSAENAMPTTANEPATNRPSPVIG